MDEAFSFTAVLWDVTQHSHGGVLHDIQRIATKETVDEEAPWESGTFCKNTTQWHNDMARPQTRAT